MAGNGSDQVQKSYVDLNQVWDMGRLVDLTAEYFNGMPIDVGATAIF